MKGNWLRWGLAVLILVVAMTICAFTITSFKYLILYVKTGVFNGSLFQMLYLSIKIGCFTGVLITVGLWIQNRFNIR
ncbi:hypothetical protein SRABI106_04445 [Rahnella aquatilis]|jgi:hypothetical protein|nr:hypothetical protein SRABI106_04445 [Rahnella aquatilis]